MRRLVRGLLAALEAFGGVPLVTVWDPTTVVLSRKQGVIAWNPVFGQEALDYRFAPEPCWPRAAQQKGTVENLVGMSGGCNRWEGRARSAECLKGSGTALGVWYRFPVSIQS